MKKFRLSLLLLFAALAPARAYGPEGHQIIGEIADKLLAHTPTGAKVSELLDGYTLREVAIIPDTIKQWDAKGVDDPMVQSYFSSHPKIAEQLRAFWKANPPNEDENSAVPNHHWFHYTDVPLAEPLEKYTDGKAGRTQWDIVHMMRSCIAVLRGEEPEENVRAITKPIAVILLAHFVGDIHQPLHVGAEYFDAQGQPANPDQPGETFADEGGNSLHLQLNGTPPPFAAKHPKLHGYWDSETVFANLPQPPLTMPKEERRAKMDAGEEALAKRLAKDAPKHWKLPADLPLEKYPEAWADEILPLARAAHVRLSFEHVHPGLDHEKTVALGDAVERAMPDGVSYRTWSAKVVLHEMHLAGWRLADLLKQTMNSAPAPEPSPNDTPTPSPNDK
ncbi:MAG: hypothetical protein H0X40_04235 [Chthoniobacterales bacterium]|nr:hypothetical protein [Chthoniobacterales bacterium]